MWIVNLALGRPQNFIVLAIFILLSGGLAILRTPKDIFPSINIPVVAVVMLRTSPCCALALEARDFRSSSS